MVKAAPKQSNDSISGLQDELEAALAVLDPQIRGVTDLRVHQGVSPELLAELNTALTELTQRRSLIQTVLDDIQKLLDDIGVLEADGYPVPLAFDISEPLLGELTNEVTDTVAGASVFHATEAMATTFAITLGSPEPKPPPMPAR